MRVDMPIAPHWLHFGDLRSMHIRALDQLAATAVRRPVDQPGRDVHRRYRYRIGPTCGRAFAAPAGDVVVEALPAQPIVESGRAKLRLTDEITPFQDTSLSTVHGVGQSCFYLAQLVRDVSAALSSG